MRCICPPFPGGMMCCAPDCVNNPPFPSEGTAADRVAAFITAYQWNEFHQPKILTIANGATDLKDVALIAADVAELVGPDTRLLRAVAAELLPHLRGGDQADEETFPSYERSDALAASLDEATLHRLVVLFNEAGARASLAYRAKRRAANVAEMRAREEKQA